MDKPAQVVLKFDKATDSFWSGFVEVIDKKTIHEVSNSVIVLIPVKSYDLADHQFIRIKLNMNNGKEVVALIPRNIVSTIVEGKGGLDKGGFYFAGEKP